MVSLTGKFHKYNHIMIKTKVTYHMAKTRLRRLVREHDASVLNEDEHASLSVGQFIVNKALKGVGTLWIDDQNIDSMEGLPAIIPENTDLRIYRVKIKNFEGMPSKFDSQKIQIKVEDCDRVESLSGMTSNIFTLDVRDCPKLTEFDGSYDELYTLMISAATGDLDLTAMKTPKLNTLMVSGHNLRFSAKLAPQAASLTRLRLELVFGHTKISDIVDAYGMTKIGVLYIQSMNSGDVIDFENADKLPFSKAAGPSGASRLSLKLQARQMVGLSRVLMCPELSTISFIGTTDLPDDILNFINDRPLPMSRKDIMAFTALCTKHDLMHLV